MIYLNVVVTVVMYTIFCFVLTALLTVVRHVEYVKSIFMRVILHGANVFEEYGIFLLRFIGFFCHMHMEVAA